MQDGRLETICARLCLLSSLARQQGDALPLSRTMGFKLLSSGALTGLVLREDAHLEASLLRRSRSLLGRASAVCEGYERYCKQGYSVLLPEDPQWPVRLRSLKKAMPLYLFAKGNLQLLDKESIAVAGSRKISEETGSKAEKIGRYIAEQGMGLICGGAKGVDTAVQRAALNAGGSAILIPAIPAHALLKEHVYRSALEEGRLLILCETPPDERFSAYKALTRNHSIYALGKWALVVASRREIGGSWAGASACLKGGWSPVYALDETGEDFSGNQALFDLGALRAFIRDDRVVFEACSEQMECELMTLLNKETTDAYIH